MYIYEIKIYIPILYYLWASKSLVVYCYTEFFLAELRKQK